MDASGESGGSALEEKFPRIAQTLCACWGKADCTAYLESLIYDQRGGRQGFPADVGAELLMLHGLDAVVDQRVPAGTLPWQRSGRQQVFAGDIGRDASEQGRRSPCQGGDKPGSL